MMIGSSPRSEYHTTLTEPEIAPESSSKLPSAHMAIEIDGRHFKDVHGRQAPLFSGSF